MLPQHSHRINAPELKSSGTDVVIEELVLTGLGDVPLFVAEATTVEPELPPEALHTGSDWPGSKLQNYYKVWQKMGANPRVVTLLQNGYSLDFRIRPKMSKIPLVISRYKAEVKQKILNQNVVEMIQKKAIVRVQKPTTLGFYSRIFIVPKPGGKWRPVIDLSALNKYLNVPTFKMETAEKIRNSLKTNEWVCSIDIKDAYFHILIHQNSQKYLRFQTNLGVYQFSALPFGLATAPLIFTMVAKELKLLAQSQGLRIHQYLDDWLLRANSQEECLENSKKLIKLVQDLGWIINFQKSELQPTQKLDFLGYHFDLTLGMVFPTVKNLERLKVKILRLKNSLSTTPRQLMSLIGTLACLEKLVPLGRLHIRPFQWYLKKYWRYPESLDKKIPVTVELLKQLSWWNSTKNLMKGSPLHPIEHNLSLFTDASQKGWGAHLGKESISGIWRSQDSSLHINVLELKAVYMALKHFAPKLKKQNVLICSDNSTVVSYLNKQGGTKSFQMVALVWRIIAWATPREIQIRARHIPGSLNVIADALSRKDKVIHSEWELNQEVFNQLCQIWHKPVVDMFATANNTKLPVYVSPVPDQNAWNIDALSIPWQDLDGYAFCPVPILPHLVQKMTTYQCRMIVIAPGWPGMAWFWDLIELSARPPLTLPLWPQLLRQPRSNYFHRNLHFLNLHAWYLDSRIEAQTNSPQRWKLELRHLRGSHQGGSIPQGGPFIGTGVSRSRWSAQNHLFHK